MRLSAIRDDVTQFAGVISKTLDVDVFIVDSNLKIVSNTYRYFDRFDMIRPVSVVGQVITTGKVIAFEDKRNFSTCQVCPDFQTCEMAGFVGVPVFYKECVVGAIALILPRLKIAQIFKDIRNSVAFLENMSDLLSSKLKDRDDYTALAILKQEREVFMDEVQEALALTDSVGALSYYNKRFAAYFGLESDALGKMIVEIVPHALVERAVQSQKPVRVRDRLIYVKHGGAVFYGMVSCHTTTSTGQGQGMLFTFRSISSIGADFTVTADPWAQLTFEVCEGQFCREAIAAARRMAKNDKTVFIETAPQMAEILLARCIHNHSSRKSCAFLTVNAADVQGLEENLLFGTPDRLYMAHGGTLFLRNVELFSLPAQLRLAELLKAGQQDWPNVRLIFSSRVNLESRVSGSCFSAELYHILLEYTIRLNQPVSSQPPLGEQSISEIEREKIAALLQSNYTRNQIAQMLGLSRATLYRKIKQYNLY